MSLNQTRLPAAILALLCGGLFTILLMKSGISFIGHHAVAPSADEVGGMELVYEIKVPPGSRPPSGTLAERVAVALKKRVDPDGSRNLIWRPQGETRLAIVIPRSPGSGKIAEVRKEYDSAERQLDKLVVFPSDVIAAVEHLTGAARSAKLEELAAGSQSRLNVYRKMAQAHDQTAAEQAKIDQAKAQQDKAGEDAASDAWARGSAEYEDLKATLDKGNLSAEEFESILDDTNVAERDQLLADVQTQSADFPRRRAALDALTKAYANFKSLHGVIDDTAELERLVRGSGVLEFHILADPTSPQPEVQKMIVRLRDKGPAPVAGDKFRWCAVDDPAVFPLRSANGFPQDYRGKRYVLVSCAPQDSMTHDPSSPAWGLARAYPTLNTMGQKVIGFEFDAQGASLFGKLTGSHVPTADDRRYSLAFLLDDKVMSAPSINSRIGGSGIIEGGHKGYTDAELLYLVNTLNAGSLPAQLSDEPISVQPVSPHANAAQGQKKRNVPVLIGLIAAAVSFAGYYFVAGAMIAARGRQTKVTT